MWIGGLMAKYKTYLWQEIRGSNWYRIQTDDPAIIRKLRKRKSASLCVWCMNNPLVVFKAQYYSPYKAKTSLQRLTNQKPKKDADSGLLFAETTPILDSKNES
jgi:hypothetical protein